MKRYSTLLFYYSAVLSTLLVLELIFSFPPPQSFILSLLFLPIPLYFALRIGTEPVSMRLSAIILTGIVIIAATILAHISIKNLYHPPQTIMQPDNRVSDDLQALKEELTKSDTTNKMILKEIASLKEELKSLKREFFKTEDILGLNSEFKTASPSPTIKEVRE